MYRRLFARPTSSPLLGYCRKAKRSKAVICCGDLRLDSCCLAWLPRSEFHGTPAHLCSYEQTYRRSIERPEEFWDEIAQQIDWIKPYEQVVDDMESPFAKWFVGGEMNTCYNALDRHIKCGYGEQVSLVYDSPVTNTIQKFTYQQLCDQVSIFAGALVNLGITKGDCVLIYMPMIPQTVIAMLACSRIGAIHSVVFGGFASEELGRRIQHCEPKVVVTASCGVEPKGVLPYKPLVDEAIDFSTHKPTTCIVYQRSMYEAKMNSSVDLDWNQAIASASPQGCTPVLATDPLYILYTSGTTGDPKGVVRPSGGYAVALNWTMKHVYGVHPGEAWWAASDLGWVVGHSYIVYAPLLARSTSVLFEGKPVGTPDAGAFFRVIEEHKVVSMFTAPTALRIIRSEDSNGECIGKYDISHLRQMFVAGEHCDKDTLDWTSNVIKAPVLDHWWQTESGWPITAHSVGLGSPDMKHLQTTGRPVPGFNVRVVNSDLTSCKRGEMGEVVIRLPLPPGVASTLWKNDEKFLQSYFKKFPGHYDSMDEGIMDFSGYVSIMTRTDDVINVAGHRLSTKAIEEALLKDEDVVDAAVVGLDDEIRGHVPFGFVVLKNGIEKPHDVIVNDAIQAVREHLGPVVAFKSAVIVPALPKTRSGKTLRSPLQKLINGKPYKLPGTVENPEVFDEIKEILKEDGHLRA